MLRKNFSLVSLAILLLVASTLIALQTSPDARPSGRDLIVIDSTGNNLGPVIGVTFDGGTTVAFPFHGKPLPILVGRNSFPQVNPLNFATTDCTGQPFQVVNGPFLTTTVLGTKNTLFVENGPVQSITVQSQLGPFSSGCSQTSFALSPAVPMKPVIDLNQLFTPPFSVVSAEHHKD